MEYEQLSDAVDDLSDEVALQKSAIDDLSALTNRKAGMLVDTASGAIASFIPDATIPDLLGVSVDIEPVQDLHGYDSPWPGGGGANQWDEQWEVGGLTSGGNKNYNLTGRIVSKNYIPVLPSTQYYFVSSNGFNRIMAFYDASKTFLTTQYGNGLFTTPQDAAYALFSTTNDTYGAVYNNDLALNYPATVTTYSPYSNLCPISGWDSVKVWNKPTHDTSADPTVTIQLGQTVYGGTLDVTNGTLTVDMVMVDLGSFNWSRAQIGGSGHYFFYYGIYSDGAKYLGKMNAEIFKTYTQDVSNWNYPDNSAIIANGNNYPVLYVRCDEYQDVVAFKTAMSGVQLVYELATPIEIQLDPVAISTISGQTNNVWADAGNVSVEFAADLKHYIDSKITAAVAALS